MPVETSSLLARAIQDHLELKRKNAELEPSMPLDRYKSADPFDNHPLFKTEEQARLEETLATDVLVHAAEPLPAWPSDETLERPLPEFDASLWSRSRDFDWGD